MGISSAVIQPVNDLCSRDWISLPAEPLFPKTPLGIHGNKAGLELAQSNTALPEELTLGVLSEKGFPSRNQSEITECPAKILRENSRNLPVPSREGVA